MRLRFLVCSIVIIAVVGFVRAANGSAGDKSVFAGEVTDSICARAGSHDEAMHMSKDMGKTAAECTIKCVEHMGAKYVLYDRAGKKTYNLSDQVQAKKFAGRRVKVTGALVKKEIKVESITAD